MKLLDELHERRKVLYEARETLRADLLQTESELSDLDTAIAALEPAVPIEASSQSEPFGSVAAETDLQTSPGEVEEIRDHSDDGYAPVTQAEPDNPALIDAQTCEPVNPRPEPETLPEPVWNETAQATKLEADALAKALDYYSPETVAERNKFNPFAMFRREGEQ